MRKKSKATNSMRKRLEREVFERGHAGFFGSIIFIVLIFFFPFGCATYKPEIRACLFAIGIIEVFRFISIRAALSNPIHTNQQYQRFFTLTLAVQISWTALFGFATLELMQAREFSVYFFGTFVTFLFGSLFSLTGSKFLFRNFLNCMMLSQLGILLVGAIHYRFNFDLCVFPVLAGIYTFLIQEGTGLHRRMIKAFHDRTKLERKNAQLVRSREALIEQTSRNVHASRLAALGEMAGGIAHEINNPLSIIDLSLESFQEHIDEGIEISREKANAAISRSQGSVKRIAGIVRGLRNFSRSGDKDPLSNCPLKDVINDTLELCQEKMKAQGVLLKVAGEDSVVIACRPVEVGQILLNLFNNSLEVVAELPLNERVIELSAQKEKGLAVLRVVDSGPPLSRETKNRIFQPFFTTKAVGAGTGLGLSISKAIARKHGGDLVLDEAEVKTTFVLTIPLAA